MPYIVNSKFQEIRKAAQGGNEKAKIIMQAMRKMSPQADIDRLMEDYYKIPTPEPVDENLLKTDDNSPKSEPVVEEITDVGTENIHTAEDVSKDLDIDTQDLFDENEIKDISFSEYITEKSKNALRAKKNADYFKAYDLKSREDFLANKVNAYKDKFNGRLGNIARKHKDIGKSLDNYSQFANDFIDDDKELNGDLVSSAYKDFTGNDVVMSSFGRYWDEDDVKTIVQGLKELIEHYGKKNIVAVLNLLKEDNDSYSNYLNGQIDFEIGRYTKSLENILK